jgi:probable rRNA maturation factor
MIQFSTQDIRFILKNKLKVREWVRTILNEEGRAAGDLSFIFCNDSYLFELNKQYLRHQTLTDIITFDYSENELVSGDIFISIERVKENARFYSKSFPEELGRVMAHGVLHLAGYKDKSPGDKLKMTDKENKCLSSFPIL